MRPCSRNAPHAYVHEGGVLNVARCLRERRALRCARCRSDAREKLAGSEGSRGDQAESEGCPAAHIRNPERRHKRTGTKHGTAHQHTQHAGKHNTADDRAHRWQQSSVAATSGQGTAVTPLSTDSTTSTCARGCSCESHRTPPPTCPAPPPPCHAAPTRSLAFAAAATSSAAAAPASRGHSATASAAPERPAALRRLPKAPAPDPYLNPPPPRSPRSSPPRPN